MARLARESGIELNHVPYKGAAPALNDLVGGHIELMIVDYPSGSGQIRAGKIRPLAVCSATRLSALPDVPTVQEALGLADFAAYAWQGLVVPAATPDPEVERLSAVLAAAVADPKVTARLEEIGLEPLEGGPAEMQALIDAERAIWVPLIRELGDHAGLTWGRHIGPVRSTSRPSAPSARRSRPSAPAGPGAWSAG